MRLLSGHLSLLCCNSRHHNACAAVDKVSVLRYVGIRLHSDRHVGEAYRSVRSIYEKNQNKMDGMAWFLLVIPVSAFGLGTWQVQRKKWKEGLITDLAAKTSLPPVDFPEDLNELQHMEFHPVRVVGRFDHSRELYLGPRTLIQGGESVSTGGSIISTGQTGFQVVTPFTLSNRELTILVNRGWVPDKKKNMKTRAEGQVQGEVELVGVVRFTEPRQPLASHNSPSTGVWLNRDLEQMAEVTGAEPICIDAVESSTIHGGPIGGQTRVTLRNEHLSYILTWYSLSAATAFMWYRQFVARVKVV